MRKETKLPEVRIYPNQYPTNINDSDTSIISRSRPVRFTTDKNEVIEHFDIPQFLHVNREKYNSKWKTPENSYQMNVGVLGPTNSGKSALVGQLAHKISAVSPKAHTTSQVIHVIKSYQINTELGFKNIQLNYYDTPGLEEKKGSFSSKSWGILGQIDFALIVIDSNKRFQESVRVTLERLRRSSEEQPLLKALVLNKIDLMTNRNRFNSLISEIEKFGKFDRIFHTSTETGYGIKQLEDYVVSMAKPGEWEYAAETKTTLTEREIYIQMMKEAIFQRTYEEIPHMMDIEIESIANKSDGKQYVKFKLGVYDENQMRLLIGKKGNNLNAIKTLFLVQMAKYNKIKPQVEMRVSIMSKTQQMTKERQQIVEPQNSYRIQAQKQSEELREKLRKKFSTQTPFTLN